MDFELIYRELERDEGRRPKMYPDSKGIPTIGIGHNLQDRPISDRAIRTIFEDDLTDVVVDLDRNLSWWRNMTENRQRVFANMTFQMGISRFLGFKNMLKAAQAGLWELAAAEMLDSDWARKDSPARAERLAKMMREG